MLGKSDAFRHIEFLISTVILYNLFSVILYEMAPTCCLNLLRICGIFINFLVYIPQTSTCYNWSTPTIIC